MKVDAVRRALSRAGVEDDDVKDALGVPPNHVRRMWNQQVVREHTALRLVDRFGIDPVDLGL